MRRPQTATDTAALLMVLEAASLAVMSLLHLTGALAGGSKPYQPSAAGIAEALISLALLAGGAALLRDRRKGRVIALATLTFAIVGFVIGLSFTIRGGRAVDVAYHATVLPLVVFTLLLVRNEDPKRMPAGSAHAHIETSRRT